MSHLLKGFLLWINKHLQQSMEKYAQRKTGSELGALDIQEKNVVETFLIFLRNLISRSIFTTTKRRRLRSLIKRKTNFVVRFFGS